MQIARFKYIAKKGNQLCIANYTGFFTKCEIPIIRKKIFIKNICNLVAYKS